MRIDRLTVQNFRCFENNTWDFTPGFNVLIGDNGSGKTAVLEALKIAIGAYLAGFSGGRFERIRPDDIRLFTGGTFEQPTLEPIQPVVVEATGEIEGNIMQWSRRVELGRTNKGKTAKLRAMAADFEDKVHNNKEVFLPVVAYYPAGRLWRQNTESLPRYIIVTQGSDNKRQAEEKGRNGDSSLPVISRPTSRFAGYRACLNAQSNEEEVRSWFTRLSLAELQEGIPNATLDAVRVAAANALPEWDKFYYSVKIDELVVRRNSGELLPTRLLSDGQRNTVSMVADLAYRCALLNPDLRDKAAAETPGIVLIDEIDLHLHPKWQRHIVNSLREVFPQIQFIATTHSPLIIQSLRPGELVDLSGGQPQDYYRQSVEEILTDEMGLDETRKNAEYQEMRRTAEEYFHLLEENQGASNGKAEELRERLDKLTLPYHDNPAYVAYYNYLEQRRLVAVGSC